MAARSLTDVFVLMRNNAIRNRKIYSNQDTSSEHMSLVELCDVEEGNIPLNKMPPVWIDQLEKAQFTLTKLKNKINELNKLHSQHLQRPTFDESSKEEASIESCTAEITTMFNSIHRVVQFIKNSAEGTSKEKYLTLNVVCSLASSLQELSIQFRSSQNGYIRQLKSREERSNKYFQSSMADNDYELFSNQNDSIDDFFVNSSKDVTKQQLLYLEEENTQIAQRREHEINAVVKSIVELNDIFKDLSQMVSNQGTILDRIDYSVEKSHTQVIEGYKQLKKADAYQRRSRKMWAIIILATTTILLLFILIIVKS